MQKQRKIVVGVFGSLICAVVVMLTPLAAFSDGDDSKPNDDAADQAASESREAIATARKLADVLEKQEQSWQKKEQALSGRITKLKNQA